MKKLLSVLLTLAMVLTLVPAAFAADFSDVKETDWFYDAANYVSENGLMVGTGKGFEPDRETSRAMIWTILARLDGVDTSVNDGAWYATAQKWSMEKGVSDGSDPDGFITREQFAAMLYRFAGMKGLVKAEDVAALTGFTDAASVTAYAVEPLSWAVACGIVGGMGDGTICPQGLATRAQVAAMLMRFCQRFDLLKEEYTVTFALNYGSEGAYVTVDVEDGGIVSQPKNPSRSGYSFQGWYTKAENGKKFDFSTKITADLTLYAHWSKTSSGGGGGGGSSHSHNYTTLISDTATCTAVGEKTWKCSCGKTKTEESPALGHLFETNWADLTTTECKRDGCNEKPGANTYYINNKADLEAFATKTEAGEYFDKKTILLTANIDMTGVTWKPVGQVAYAPVYTFKGTFDGQNHTISNLTVAERRDQDGKGEHACTGFFGAITDGGVQNVNFDNATVTGTHWGGVVVGYVCDGCPSVSIENCHVTNSSVTLKAEQVNGEWDNGDKAGGIVGYIGAGNGETVIDCSVENTEITAYRDLGGIVGYLGADNSISDCMVDGNELKIDRTQDYKNYGPDESKYDCGKYVGETEAGAVVNGVQSVTAAQLQTILTASGNVTLDKDYVLTDEWTPANYGSASGAIVIDGDGHSISGLTAALLCDNYGFNSVTVKNLTIKDSNIAAGYNASGAIIAYINQQAGLTLENCHLVNSTVGYGYDLQTGGLVGMVTNMDMTIKDCSVKNSTINGGSSGAGIVGQATTETGKTMTIKNCSVTGSTITSADNGNWRVGAMVGTANGNGTLTISGCTESGNTYTMANSSSTNPGHNLYGRAVDATVTIN